MEIFVWIDLLIKNDEERDHRHQNAKASLKPIAKSILLMNRELSNLKIIIVAILIINNMNVGLQDLALHQ
ncbi:TPA: hypothetical protein DCZ39_06615 [Patescibacteria group bacterium]|nr:hypothetical protein [Candidatus Gracilibacteria bacterium]